MATVSISDTTHKRLNSVLNDMTHSKKRDLSYDDVINELIDVYQDNNWLSGGAGAGGG